MLYSIILLEYRPAIVYINFGKFMMANFSSVAPPPNVSFHLNRCTSNVFIIEVMKAWQKNALLVRN